MYRRGTMGIRKKSVSMLTIDYGRNISIKTQLFKELVDRVPDGPPRSHDKT